MHSIPMEKNFNCQGKNYKIIDLSITLWHEMPVHPEDPRIGFINFADIKKHGCHMTQLFLSTHGGTHMDAPMHFIDGGLSIDRIDLENCIGNAVVVKLQDMEEKRDLEIEDFKKYEESILPGTIILVRTDWYKVFPDSKYYTDFKGISSELAKWLVKKQISLIGVETPAIHPSEHKLIHDTFLKNNIIIVEGLANIDLIKLDEVFFIALPLKLKGLDGSPIRAIAIEE